MDRYYNVLLFVLSLIICSILAIFNMPIFVLLLLGIYTLFNIVNLIIIFINHGFYIGYLILPFVFFILHVSYGIGTVVGLLNGPIRKIKLMK